MATRAVAWGIPILLVAGLTVGAISVAAPPSANPMLDAAGPTDLGTTWVYRTTTDGKPTGLEVAQITGASIMPGESGGIVEEHFFQNLFGNGPLHVIQYLDQHGDRVLETGRRMGGTFSEDQPPAPLIDAPLHPGRSWHYHGSITSQQTTFSTKVVGIGTVHALGRDLKECPHLRTLHRATDSSGTVSVQTDDSWLCPSFGVVKSVIDDKSSGKVYREVLAEFHGKRGNAGGGALPSVATASNRQPGEVPAIDQARTDAVPGASLDTNEYAWTMARKGTILYPPVGRAGLSVLAEDDGTVSAVDPRTGEVRWQLQLKGPVVASPVLAGPLVFVADGSKSLYALDADTGFARWVAHFSDLVSAPPVVAGDQVVVPTEDSMLRALRLRDGQQMHSTNTGFLITTPPALAGAAVVVAGPSAGGVAAYRLPDLSSTWSTSVAAHLAPSDTLSVGPVVAGGLAIVGLPGGELFAFDLRDGSLRWRATSPRDVEAAPAVSGNALVEVAGHFVVGRSLADGTERWRQRIGPGLATSPVILGDTAVVLDDAAHLHTFALDGGTPRGTVTLPPPDQKTALDSDVPMSFVDGSLVVPTHNGGPWPFTILFAFASTRAGKAKGVRFEGVIRSVPSTPINAATLRDGHLLMATAVPAGVYDVPPSGAATSLYRGKGFVVSAVPAGDLVLVQDDDTLLAVPRTGGAPTWTFKVGQPSPVVQPAVVGDTAVVPVLGKGLVGLDVNTGAVRWSRPFPGSIGQSSPLALPGGQVAYAVGGLTVLDAATGRVMWHQPGTETFGRIAYDHGSILVEAVTAQTAALVAVDAATGKLEWAEPFGPQVALGPATGDGVVVAVDDSNTLTAFDESSGSKLWAVPLRTPPNGDPVVVGNRVVVQEQGRFENVNQRDYRLSAFDAHTGGMEAQWELAGSGITHAGFGAEGGTLLAPGVASGIVMYLLRMVPA